MVSAVLLVLTVSKMNRRALMVALWISMVLLLAACASDAGEQAQVVSVPPTAVPTTAPLAVPTAIPTSVPTPTVEPQPPATSTPIPAPVTPTVPPAPTAEPTPPPVTDSAAAQESADTPEPEPTEIVETPTPVATPTAEATETPDAASDPAQDVTDTDPDPDVGTEATPVPETPTAIVVASGEPPLECYDAEVQLYRAFVDGVDALSFEGGRVYCGGAGTNAVSAERSYRHSTGLIVQRNANYLFNNAGTGYIPFSGFVHFCSDGQPASAPVTAETVPALLVVIDAEAQRQVAQGASAPAAFGGSGAQC